MPRGPGWHDAESMHHLTSRGYGEVLWEPDGTTVRAARVTRFMDWLRTRGGGAGGAGGGGGGGAGGGGFRGTGGDGGSSDDALDDEA